LCGPSVWRQAQRLFLRHNVLGDVIGANDKINIGCIGVGGRGTSVMRTGRWRLGGQPIPTVLLPFVTPTKQYVTERSNIRKNHLRIALFVCLSVCFSVRLPVCLFVCRCVRMFAVWFVGCLVRCMYVDVCLYVCMSYYDHGNMNM
jgi:hypothetical protein